MLPMAVALSELSSTTKSRHVPAGFVPLNIDKVAPWGPGGAGLPKESPKPLFVGRYMPDDNGDPIGSAAPESSKVSVRFVATPLPTSDMSTQVCPAGPTSSTSTSAANAGWLNPVRTTCTFVTVPRLAGIVIVDG